MLLRPINLALVDDHSLFRKTLKCFLAEQKNLQIVIQVSTMPELFEKLSDVTVDVLLMDIFLPEMDRKDALFQMRTEYPATSILALSGSTDPDLISDLMDKGIHGFISKSEEPDELLQAISAVADNRIYRNRLFTEALYRHRQNNLRHYPANGVIKLSDREKRVLQLLWQEKSNREIADELFLGVRSVEKIRQDMKEKTGAKSLVGLFKYALDKRIIGVSSQSSDFIR